MLNVGDWVKVKAKTSYLNGAVGFILEEHFEHRKVQLTMNANGQQTSGKKNFDDYFLEPIPYSIHPEDLYTLTDIALYKGEKQWFDDLHKKEMQP
jgi:hypothetical protein